MSQETLNEHQTLLTAYFDGELDDAGVRRAEAYLAEHPEAAEALAEQALLGGALRAAAEAWEEGPEFEPFSAGVMARLPPADAATSASSGRELGLWSTFATWLAGHQALAAAATVMVVLGAGSVLYLNVPGRHRGPLPALELRGATTQIEDLSFESGSAVVYKTEADVTVIWLTEDDAP